MKKILSLFTVLAFVSTSFVFAETELDTVDAAATSNYNFPLTYKGVTMFMEDLEVYEYDNFTLLQPQYEKIRVKHRNALITQIVGGVLAVGGIATSFILPDDGPNNLILMGGAGLIGVGAFSLSLAIGPKQEDFYRLVNIYNRKNPETQIKIETKLVF